MDSHGSLEPLGDLLQYDIVVPVVGGDIVNVGVEVGLDSSTLAFSSLVVAIHLVVVSVQGCANALVDSVALRIYHGCECVATIWRRR